MKRATLLVGIERDKDNKQLSPEVRATALSNIRKLAAGTFGGYTLSNAAGGWFNEQNVLVEEGAIRLDIYTTLGINALRDFAREAARMFDQHSVVLDYDGEGEFVESEGSLVRVNAQDVDVPSEETWQGQGNYAAERAA